MLWLSLLLYFGVAVHAAYPFDPRFPVPVIRVDENVAEEIGRWPGDPLIRDLYDLAALSTSIEDPQLVTRMWGLKSYVGMMSGSRRRRGGPVASVDDLTATSAPPRSFLAPWRCPQTLPGGVSIPKTLRRDRPASVDAQVIPPSCSSVCGPFCLAGGLLLAGCCLGRVVPSSVGYQPLCTGDATPGRVGSTAGPERGWYRLGVLTVVTLGGLEGAFLGYGLAGTIGSCVTVPGLFRRLVRGRGKVLGCRVRVPGRGGP